MFCKHKNNAFSRRQVTTVYHKYGELDGELHDASIIVKNGRAYAFVIYTQKSANDTNPDTRVAIIHQLTQATVTGLLR